MYLITQTLKNTAPHRHQLCKAPPISHASTALKLCLHCNTFFGRHMLAVLPPLPIFQEQDQVLMLGAHALEEERRLEEERQKEAPAEARPACGQLSCLLAISLSGMLNGHCVRAACACAELAHLPMPGPSPQFTGQLSMHQLHSNLILNLKPAQFFAPPPQPPSASSEYVLSSVARMLLCAAC
eukprot:1160195-Pelagomonas_calceolata.AAC.2